VSDRWGLIQSYFLDKSMMIGGMLPEDVLTFDERRIAEQARRDYDGKLSREILTGLGLGQQDARRLQNDWRVRGWAFNDPQRGNALYMTPKLGDLLTSRPAQPALTNRQPTQPTGQPAQPTDLNGGNEDGNNLELE
jgi:hypothetical protein